MKRVACRKSPQCNCNSLFDRNCTPKLCISPFQCWLNNSYYVSKCVLIRKSLHQCYSKFWSFSMLSNQSSSLWYAHTERLLRMFISKSVERIIEAKTCFHCRYALILLIFRNNTRFFQQLTSQVNHPDAYYTGRQINCFLLSSFRLTKYDLWKNDWQIS